jgi:hypothetical protein
MGMLDLFLQDAIFIGKVVGLFIVYALIIETIVELLVEASPLEGLRAWVARRGTIGPFDLATFVTCGYCVSVWVSIPFAFLLPSIVPVWLQSEGSILYSVISFLDVYMWWFFNWMILHRVSNYIHMKHMSKQPLLLEE